MMFSKSAALDTATPAADVSGTRILGRGILLQLANPKALIFFTAFLPQFVSPNAPVARQMLILGVTSTVLEFIILCGYGWFASRLSGRFTRSINRTAGAMLVACGAGLALTSQK